MERRIRKIMIDLKSFKENWLKIQESAEKSAIECGRNPDDVQIVAVSKTHPAELIKIALYSGIKVFGENYAQELVDKALELADYEIQPEWHFIGHLQTNKVKHIIPFVKMIHSVDSLKLAEEISKQAGKLNKTIDILLQVNTSQEESKFGCNPEEAPELYEKIQLLDNIKLKGLMTIGSFSDDANISRKEFGILVELRKIIIEKNVNVQSLELSMGMSHDYSLAIKEGSTIVRIGTSIFGNRYYTR
jgi:pyridoxal phosphate enzyme (YggS family)